MSTLEKLERAVAELKGHEMQQFREWFEEFDSNVWDKQIESDAQSGKLDEIAERAIADFKKGDFKKI